MYICICTTTTTPSACTADKAVDDRVVGVVEDFPVQNEHLLSQWVVVGGRVPDPRRVPVVTFTDFRLFLVEPVHMVLHELEHLQ